LAGESIIRRILLLTGLLAALLCYPAASEARTVANKAGGAIPVFEGDVTRPYEVIGEIKDNLRKPFAFMASPSKEKILAEIWERARKMGADAVINARFGETQRTMFDHGRTPISGTAIKYTEVAKPKD
jgi:uncharacterized protein YbjQ (UPF0145 family)